MNKTCCCAGGLCTSIWLKCKNKLNWKNPLFNQSWTSPKVFQSWFNPKHGYKIVNKRSQMTNQHLGLLSERIITFWRRLKTADALPIHTTIKAPHNKIPCILTTRLRLLIAYWLMPHHCITSKQDSQPRTTLTHSPPDPYLLEEVSLYLF